MKRIFILLLCMANAVAAYSQQKTENIIVITLDGMRWQEVFGGADSVLINDSIFTPDMKSLKSKYWASSPELRRQKLMPFFWNVIAKQGQVYGNRWFGNKVDNANRYSFSYPGYNEIITGYPDTAVNSNDKIANKNENVLEFLNRQPKYRGRVAAFTSWDVFDAILNEKRSGVPVSSGFDPLHKKSSATLHLLDDMQMKCPRPWGNSVRPDFITYYMAKEFLKAHHTKILYIGLGETDEYAHEGRYDSYLNAARLTDELIADLWSFIQSTDEYRNNTTLLITTDHGRGDEIKSNWKHHGEEISDAFQIWIAAIGPDTTPLGELKTPGQLYQEQIASTIAAVLGFQFTANHPVAEPIEATYKRK